jgi:hypothetical protein
MDENVKHVKEIADILDGLQVISCSQKLCLSLCL